MNQTARGLTIYFCGHESCAPGHFFGPAIRTHYLLHVILKGKGIYRTGSKEYSLKEGEGFLIKPQEVTYYEADPLEPWEYAWVSFAGGDGEFMGLRKEMSGNAACLSWWNCFWKEGIDRMP